MPNTVPPTDTVAHFEMKLAAARAKSLVDFGLYGLRLTQNVSIRIFDGLEAGCLSMAALLSQQKNAGLFPRD